MKSRLILACFMIGWLVTGAFTPAAPSIDKNELKITVNETSVLDYGCGFQIKETITGTAMVHTTVAGGNIGMVMWTMSNVKTTWTNMTTGKSVWSPTSTMHKVGLFSKGTRKVTMTSGMGYRIVVPGQGLVLADVGRVATTINLSSSGSPTSFTVKRAGQHPTDTSTTKAVFCQVLQ